MVVGSCMFAGIVVVCGMADVCGITGFSLDSRCLWDS